MGYTKILDYENFKNYYTGNLSINDWFKRFIIRSRWQYGDEERQKNDEKGENDDADQNGGRLRNVSY